MRLKRIQGEFISLTNSTGAVDSLVSINSTGQAVLCNKDADPYLPPVGFVRYISSSGIASVQTQGPFPMSSTAGDIYWVGSSGNITNTVPTAGILQKVGIGMPNSQLWIKIDTDIISL